MVTGGGGVGRRGRGCSEGSDVHIGEEYGLGNLTQTIHYAAYLKLAERVDLEFLTKPNKKVTV